ncbi:MAG TPA: Mth938-like domain-containing protein [Gammaproteobacteria bacterium]|nr:Mth938-like domain-containing protein [Gammaproteobacteria bacterium]
MKIERATSPEENARLIRRYGDGFIVVNEATIETSVILTPTTFDTNWPPESFDELTAAHMEMLLATEPDLVLLGTGRVQRFPKPEIMAPLYQGGVGVEVMQTAAACRTFNILLNEGRKVAAALLMI